MIETVQPESRNPKKKPAPAPVVWDYVDYRVYLRDFLSHKRQAQAGFSVRQFSLKAGISTENYLLKVIRGEKRLGMKLAEAFIQAIPLKASGAEYFRAMVTLGLADDAEQLSRAQDRLEQLRRKRRNTAPVTDHSILHHWYYSAIWELGACPKFELTPESASRVLVPKVSAQQAKEAIEFLEGKGYLVRRKDRWIQADTPVLTTDERTDLLLRHHHRENVQNSLPAIDLPIEKRGFYGLTIAVSDDRIPEIKKRIKEFMEGLQAELALDPKANRIMRVNAHAFPLTTDELPAAE